MGQEIPDSHFTEQDFLAFRERLAAETETLAQWFRERRFSTRAPVGGYELEAWLVDGAGDPAPVNEALLAAMQDPLVVPELARFNIELNGHPQTLQGKALSLLHEELADTWARCATAAAGLDARLMMVGILPTLRETQLDAANMSPSERYRALNEQVFRQRQGRPLHLDILGVEHLATEHCDVMLESATTSFQIHLKVAPARAARLYNLAQILSAPLVGVGANSPFLFGHDLWAETRIPLFEQSVEVGGYAGAAQGPVHRVSFGTGYVRASLLECFEENLEHFPPLLPVKLDQPDALPHLRLHNGTIWRWNRPLLGFDDDGTPHLRIEHRVLPGGPSVPDLMANAAFFFGLMAHFGGQEPAPETLLPFATARDNFYAAAREGLEANIVWLDGRRGRLAELIGTRLVPAARAGLEQLGIDAADRERYLDIIAARAASGRNGAAWQRAWVARHGRDWHGLVAAYLDRQEGGEPVHGWSL